MRSIYADLQLEPVAPIHLQIVRHFERLIRTRQLAAGQRVPSSRELAVAWGANYKVVQKAMRRLKLQGLLERMPRRGTFVKASTDRAVIGVLFGPSLGEETAHFYRAILKAFQDEIEQRQWTCWSYDGLTGTKGLPLSADSPVYQRLAGDLRDHGFKGLIEFAPGTKGFGKMVASVPLPRVTVETHGNTDLIHDLRHFGRTSIEFVAAKGRTRIAYFRTKWHLTRESEDIESLFDAAHERGLPKPQIEPMLFTEQGYRMEQFIYEKALRILQRWQKPGNGRTHPDALLVADDIAMRAVALAIVRCGIRVPDDLLVVTQASEGIDLHYGIPVVRYEFSPREIVQRIIELLWRRMLGQSLPPLPIMIQGRIKEVA